MGQGIGDRYHPAAQAEGNSECQPAPQTMGIVSAAVHGDYMRNGVPPAGPGAVYGHGELVAVGQGDPMTTKRLAEPLSAGPGNGTLQSEALDSDSGARELAREPAFAVGGQDRQVLGASCLELGGQVGKHPFGPPGTVGFDQVRNAGATDPDSGVRRQGQSFRRASPDAHA